MFYRILAAIVRSAFSIARNFTLPIVLSVKDVRGRCSASIVTFTVRNACGWILTAC